MASDLALDTAVVRGAGRSRLSFPDPVLAGHFRHRRVLPLVLRLGLYVLMLLLALLFAFPLLWMLTMSLKPDNQQYSFPPQWIPSTFHWQNYILGWTTVGFGHFFYISFLYALLSTAGVVVSCSLAAYALARLRFRARTAVFSIVLATLMLPPQVTLIPVYLLFRDLHWINTLRPLIVPQWFAVNAFSVFLLRQFFMTLPRDLDDAARIDGASEFGIFRHVILPLSLPALSVVALFQGVFAWSDFFGPLIYESSQRNFPVALGLTYFQDQYGAMHLNQMMAMTVLSVVPVFVVFFLFQRYFIRGIVLSGVSR